MALRWKKHDRPTGLMSIGAGPRGSTLRDGDEEYAVVYCARVGHRETGWYWVSRVGGTHVNTCNDQAPDETTAKQQAMAHVRQHIKGGGNAA